MPADEDPRPNQSRDQILDSAEMLMAQNGYFATSIADVCRASGLPVGSVYWYFKNKFGLLAAVMERGSIQFFEELPRISDFAGTGRQRFDAWFESNAERLIRQPHFLHLHLALALQDGLGDEVKSISQRVRARAIERLSEAIYPILAESGVLNADQVAEDLATLMLATVDGMMIGLRIDAGLDPRRLLDRFRTGMMAIIDGLAANAAVAPAGTEARRASLTADVQVPGGPASALPRPAAGQSC